MPDRTEFTQDLERDAILVSEAYRRAQVEPDGRGVILLTPFGLVAAQFGFTPDEAFVHHPAWLRRQGKHYIDAVAARADQLLGGKT